MRLPLVAATVFAMTTPLATGAQPTNMFGMSGTCEELTVDGTDISNACHPNILQIAYDDGRVGLYAFAGDKIFTFSGASDDMVGDEVHQDIDLMILGTDGEDALPVTARGTCIYENPFAGPARFECTARIKGYEPFHLVFITDGTAPTDEMAD